MTNDSFLRKPEKGGPSRVVDTTTVDAIIHMAEFHAHILKSLGPFLGADNEAAINESLETTLQTGFAGISPEMLADVRPDWDTQYRQSFWRTYHREE